MKFKFKIKKIVDTDVELNDKLIEKGMDLHDKNWEKRLNIKHNSKKEILELKHKHHLENEEQKLKKKSAIEQVFDGINTTRKIEIEEQNKKNKNKTILSAILFVVGIILAILGFTFGKNNPGLLILGIVSIFPIAIAILLLVDASNN